MSTTINFRSRQVLVAGLVIASLLVVLVWSLRATIWMNEPPHNEDDAALIRAVESAAQQDIPIKDIEAFVGQQASVNTFRHEPFPPLATRIGGDPPESTPAPDWSEWQDVIFWIRPTEMRKYHKIIGIAWSTQG